MSFEKSRLFFTNDNSEMFNGEDDQNVIWQDVAELDIKGDGGSPVQHLITGLIQFAADDDGDSVAVADFQLRILRDGQVICERRVRFAAETGGDGTEVASPFAIQCYDTLPDGGRHTLRLQADLLDERLAKDNTVFLAQVDWSAVVWED